MTAPQPMIGAWPPSATTRSVLIVCTRNRPSELAELLQNLSRVPDVPATLVVDSSDDDLTFGVVHRHCETSDRPNLAYLSSEPGLPRQRTNGVSTLPSAVTIVHFIDDDVIVEPGYFAALESALLRDPHVMGVGGSVVNAVQQRASRFRRAFLLESPLPGAVLRSGVNVQAGAVSQPTRVRWLSGCSMSYHRRAFEHASFDSTLEGVGIGEDLDFSFQVGRVGLLVVTPAARLLHRQAAPGRATYGEWLRAATAGRYRFAMGVGSPWTTRTAFWWSVVGDLTASLAEGLILRRRSRALRCVAIVRGCMDAVTK